MRTRDKITIVGVTDNGWWCGGACSILSSRPREIVDARERGTREVAQGIRGIEIVNAYMF